MPIRISHTNLPTHWGGRSRSAVRCYWSRRTYRRLLRPLVTAWVGEHWSRGRDHGAPGKHPPCCTRTTKPKSWLATLSSLLRWHNHQCVTTTRCWKEVTHSNFTPLAVYDVEREEITRELEFRVSHRHTAEYHKHGRSPRRSTWNENCLMSAAGCRGQSTCRDALPRLFS